MRLGWWSRAEGTSSYISWLPGACSQRNQSSGRCARSRTPWSTWRNWQRLALWCGILQCLGDLPRLCLAYRQWWLRWSERVGLDQDSSRSQSSTWRTLWWNDRLLFHTFSRTANIPCKWSKLILRWELRWKRSKWILAILGNHFLVFWRFPLRPKRWRHRSSR